MFLIDLFSDRYQTQFVFSMLNLMTALKGEYYYPCFMHKATEI